MSEIGQTAESLSKELFGLCNSNSLSEEGVREIIDRRGLVSTDCNVSDYRFFHEACKNENVTEEIIRCLLECFPEAASDATASGWTPLHYACSNKNVTLGIIQLLIDAAPDSVRSVGNDGVTPLHCLCDNNKVHEDNAIQIVELLIEKYPEAARHADRDGDLPIHYASKWRSPEFCRVLIETYPGSERIMGGGILPLHYACTVQNSLATVEYLYKLYPEAINRATIEVYPIHAAIIGMQQKENPAAAVEIVQFLLNCDPDVKLQKYRGRSLLRYSCSLTYTESNIEFALEMIKAIYDAYPEAIKRNRIASNIQHYHQRIQTFINGELVYARQAKDHSLMTTPDDNGRLPLHAALRSNFRLGSIKLLVKGNPHAVQSPDNSGALPLHIACEHHDSANNVRYLIGLDTTSLGATDREGNTALHYACRGAKYDTIELLLGEYDAVSVSKQNADKKLPIEILWESKVVEDRGSLKYTESVFQLLRSYPEMVTINNLALEQPIDVDQMRNVKKRKLDHLDV